MSKNLFRTFGPVNLGLTAAFEGPEAVSQSKKYKAQQQSGHKRISASVPPGGVPNMKKVSAHQALRYYIQKQAAIPKLRKLPFGSGMFTLPGALALGAGTALGGMGAYGVAKGVGNVYQNFQSKRMFKELTQRYPEIKRHPKAHEYFELIVAYAPSLMRHPAAIGDFLRRQLEYPMSSVEFIKQLADLEGVVAKTEGYGVASRFGQDVSHAGGGYLGPMTEEARVIK